MGGTIHDYFRRALWKPGFAAPAGPAAPLSLRDGNCAAFRLVIAGGRVASARYRCTSCVTLVALCEHLAEVVTGMPLEEAERLRPEHLLGLHPEIPDAKRDRAVLAVQAMRAALTAALLATEP